MTKEEIRPEKFKAVAFDLLTALINSWAFWMEAAGDDEIGRRWRWASLRFVTAAGAYRPYEDIVREAADETGVSSRSDWCCAAVRSGAVSAAIGSTLLLLSEVEGRSAAAARRNNPAAAPPDRHARSRSQALQHIVQSASHSPPSSEDPSRLPCQK